MSFSLTQSTVVAVTALCLISAPTFASEAAPPADIAVAVQGWVAKQQDAFSRAVEAQIPAAVALVDAWVIPVVFGVLPKATAIAVDTGFNR